MTETLLLLHSLGGSSGLNGGTITAIATVVVIVTLIVVVMVLAVAVLRRRLKNKERAE